MKIAWVTPEGMETEVWSGANVYDAYLFLASEVEDGNYLPGDTFVVFTGRGAVLQKIDPTEISTSQLKYQAFKRKYGGRK